MLLFFLERVNSDTWWCIESENVSPDSYICEVRLMIGWDFQVSAY